MNPLSAHSTDGSIVALAGGVGAARMLLGFVQVVDPASITAIVNTGDDREFYGVHVSPDLDIVTYTLAGRVDPEKGFGIAGDTFSIVDSLAERGHETWFRLGDRDFAQCLHRTLRLRAGDGLAQITDDTRRAHGLATRVLPMSEDPCATFVELDDGRVIHFEEYLVRERSPDNVKSVDLRAAAGARPGPGVLEAISSARCIVICPSNPVVSIGPILEIPGIRQALCDSPAPVVAVSPIVGGAPIKGPADRLLRGTGSEVSARGVAERYRDFLDGMVIDQRDADLANDIEAMGLRVLATDTLMTRPEVSARLAESVLQLAQGSA